ncbi:MAG: transposase family protein, partial [Gammaproteobacteria bacterium]|nr:transposase family protein [Gammaproteobacteria bacterium]
MLTEDQLLVQKIDTMTGEKWRILVPDDMKQEVFELCHMTDGAAHFGIHATVSRILRTFNYPGLQTDVRLRIAACHHCLQKVTQARLHAGIHVPIRNGYPLQSLNIDFIAGLNTCADGTTTVLSVQDEWSRFCQLYPLKEARATNVIRSLTDLFIAVFGCPAEIRTDRGPQFTGTEFTQWMRGLGIKHVLLPVHNAQSNPVERLHRTVQMMLRATMEAGDTQWQVLLPGLAMAYNSKINVSTGVTPALAFLGHELAMPVDLIL